jgi:hypothetical protein
MSFGSEFECHREQVGARAGRCWVRTGFRKRAIRIAVKSYDGLAERSAGGCPFHGMSGGQLLINVVKLLRVHGGCLGIERR